MNYNREVTDYTYLEGAAVQKRNLVLRNTYWLLALSMVPTVLGAMVGLYFNLLANLSTIAFFVLFFGGSFALIFAIQKTKNSSLGVVFLLGFTFFMGLMLSNTLGYYLARYTNGSELIALAFGGTAAIFFAIALTATTIKRDLSFMGKWLFVGLIMLFVAMVANIFLGLSALAIAISVIAIGLFSAYLLYDIKQVIDGGETNYITATLSIYLDLINIFIHLLNLLGIFGGDD